MLFVLVNANALDEKKDAVSLDWYWIGALTSSSFRINLHFSTALKDEFFHFQIQKENENVDSNLHLLSTLNNIYHYEVTSLQPDTVYILQLSVNTTTLLSQRITTAGAVNYTIAFSSCATAEGNASIFTTIASHAPLAFFHLGDLHYGNLATANLTAYRRAYDTLLTSEMGIHMSTMPTVYMFDDHDFGPDNSDKMAPGRKQALDTYREYVPHYPLDKHADNVQNDVERYGGSVHQRFVLGQVLYLLTDLRSQRSPNIDVDSNTKTVLGKYQKTWFLEQITTAMEDDTIHAIVWCNTMPWIDDERKWGQFKTEQNEIVSFLNKHRVLETLPMIILSGDAHMLAVDDG